MQAKERLLADWWQAAAEGNLRGVVMLAHRRADVAELNEGARALLRQVGQLGEHRLLAGEREFRSGDRVTCRQNDSTLGVCNGTRATVQEVEPKSASSPSSSTAAPSAESRPATRPNVGGGRRLSLDPPSARNPGQVRTPAASGRSPP